MTTEPHPLSAQRGESVTGDRETERFWGEGEFCRGQCPRCHASLLMNRRNAVWCSRPGCSFGLDVPVKIGAHPAPVSPSESASIIAELIAEVELARDRIQCHRLVGGHHACIDLQDSSTCDPCREYVRLDALLERAAQAPPVSTGEGGEDIERAAEAIAEELQVRLGLFLDRGTACDVAEAALAAAKGPPSSVGFDSAAGRETGDGRASTARPLSTGSNPTLSEGDKPRAGEGWVACSERMPDDHGIFLCYWPSVEIDNDETYHGCVSTAFYDNDDKSFRGEYHGPAQVSHWMPLPKGPRRE